jgi:hypothetical protein
METAEESTIAEDFLTQSVQHLLRQLQQNWTNTSIVMAFTNPAAAFEVDLVEESLLFHRRDKIIVNISNGLWDGSTSGNMYQIITTPDWNQKAESVGYYVSRIS